MYVEVFAVLVAVCGVCMVVQNRLEKASHQDGGSAVSSMVEDGGTPNTIAVQKGQRDSFSRFQLSYLVVYYLAVSSDWLQGPYVYALYSDYGYDKQAIGQLFIAGFGSSALFGTFVAAVADKFGRKSNVIVFCVTYALSCVTKHSPNFWVLMIGRVLGGIATSILFSAFEAWLVSEHHSRNYPGPWLSETFAKAQFGNGVVAIVSGQLAGQAANTFGKVAPFDMSLVVLVLCGLLVSWMWSENYGDERQSVGAGLGNAWNIMLRDRRILMIGLIQSCFEGAMYTFVFVWTPAMQARSGDVEIPHGMIFSSFMVCMMIGSSLFTVLVSKFAIEKFLRVCIVLALGVFVNAIALNSLIGVYGSFLAFEVICGIYFPSFGTLRSRYIPEEVRSAIMNFFRLPLNIIVVAMMYRDLDMTTIFSISASLMLISLVGLQVLIHSPSIAHADLK
ncbi:Molybdate-anion transporter [Porphyridium purpureum]|uniref:Molybdate-anion transporter n=1 Tax=Porphyridium purpureum TaxID=35688 RepID=A0A5J4YM62_PORPP|nr:Molybdate-anion transporter [Porphyridium purpureum]|eukprot:POR3298..scf249_10